MSWSMTMVALGREPFLDQPGKARNGWLYSVDDLTGPHGLEQSNAPGSPFDVPGHLGGVAMLACGAVKSKAAGQMEALLTVVVGDDDLNPTSLGREPALDLPDKAWTIWFCFDYDLTSHVGQEQLDAALVDVAVGLSLWQDAWSTVMVDDNGCDIVCTALVDAPVGLSLWRDAWSTVVVYNDGRDMASLDRAPAVDRFDKASTS
jgi:hypothetical protein